MANYDTQYPIYDVEPPPKRWPLAGVMAIDLIVIGLAVLVLTTIISVVFIGIRAAQQGGGLLGSGGTVDQARALELLGTDGVFTVLLIQNGIFMLVPVLRLRLLRREPLARIGFQAQHPVRLTLLGLGLGILVLIGNAILGYLFNSAGIQQNQAEQYPLYEGDYAGQALFLIGAAVLAPLGEEVLFRGYVFNAIRQTFQEKSWGLPLAYLVSSLLFMAAHSLAATQGLIGLLVPTFLMGMVLAWAMNWTGSLLPGIIAHAMNNSVALAALLFCVNNPGMCPSF